MLFSLVCCAGHTMTKAFSGWGKCGIFAIKIPNDHKTIDGVME